MNASGRVRAEAVPCRVPGVDLTGTSGCEDRHGARIHRLQGAHDLPGIVGGDQVVVRSERHWVTDPRIRALSRPWTARSWASSVLVCLSPSDARSGQPPDHRRLSRGGRARLGGGESGRRGDLRNRMCRSDQHRALGMGQPLPRNPTRRVHSQRCSGLVGSLPPLPAGRTSLPPDRAETRGHRSMRWQREAGRCGHRRSVRPSTADPGLGRVPRRWRPRGGTQTPRPATRSSCAAGLRGQMRCLERLGTPPRCRST